MEYTHLGHKELINKSSRLLVGFIQEYKSRLSLYLSGKNFSLLLFVKGRTVISKQWLFTVSLYSAVPSIMVSIENIKGVHRIYSFGHKELAKKSSKPLTIFFLEEQKWFGIIRFGITFSELYREKCTRFSVTLRARPEGQFFF